MNTIEGPCEPWPTARCCADACIPAVPAARNSEQVFAVAVASESLWRLTAGIYGTCPEKVRPRRPSYANDQGYRFGYDRWTAPVQLDRATWWISLGCGCPMAGCSCAPPCEVLLPGPVAEITQVQIGADVLNPAAYRLDMDDRLVRVDGECFPDHQDLGKPLGADGTWSVAYKRGIPVPPGGIRAVTALACELLKECRGQKCRLPRRTTSVTREGLSVTIMDPLQLLKEGLTGIEEADAWISQVNPNRLKSQPTVWSPDLPQARWGRGQGW